MNKTDIDMSVTTAVEQTKCIVDQVTDHLANYPADFGMMLASSMIMSATQLYMSERSLRRQDEFNKGIKALTEALRGK